MSMDHDKKILNIMANKLLYIVVHNLGEKVNVRFDDGCEKILSPASVTP